MKSLGIFSLFVLVSLSTFAAEKEEFYIGDPDCRVFNPYPQSDEKITWSGECKDGFAVGKGILQWYMHEKPTSRYEGEMAQGRPHGKGLMKYADGAIYEGEFKAGEEHGTGTATYPNGTRYEGSWEEGKRDGKGTFIHKDGSRIEVVYRNGRRVDQGNDFAASYSARFLRSYQAAKAYAEKYDNANDHKAFAQSALHAWGWSAGHPSIDAAKKAALADCNSRVGPEEPPCVVFDVDGDLIKEAAAEEQALIIKFSNNYITAILKAVDPLDKVRVVELLGRLQLLEKPAKIISHATANNYARGVAAFKEGKNDLALELLKKAAEGSQGIYESQYALAAVLLKSGRFQEADAAIRSALRLDPTKRQAWLTEAILQTKLGSAETAQAALVAAYELANNKEKLEALDEFRTLAEREENAALQTIFKTAVSRIEEHFAAERAAAKQSRMAWKNANEAKFGETTWRNAIVNYSTCSKPAYPRSSQRNGEQGTVTLVFHLNRNGNVLDSFVAQSSGHSTLDDAARQALSLCQFFLPENPTASQLWSAVQYVWRLE